MKRYEWQRVTFDQRTEVGAECDGCGVSSEKAWPPLVEVVIAINEGEEGGHRTELDYCNDCLVARAEAFTAAGSRAPLVTGDDL